MSLRGASLLVDERGLETRLQPSASGGPSSRPSGRWQLPKKKVHINPRTSRGRLLACPGFPASPGLVEETMLDSLAENLRLDYHRQATQSSALYIAFILSEQAKVSGEIQSLGC